MVSGVSVLKPAGYQKSNACGYCKNPAGSCTYYMSCKNMRTDHYQDLIDRGWRRSGTTYYKPDLARSCCPQYTIRINPTEYQSKREHRSAVNKLNEHILGAEYRWKAARLCPRSREEKLQKRDKFDLLESVHRAEYNKLPRPVGQKSQKPIEPAHKFEVNLEAATCTKEKHEVFLRYQTQIHKDPASRWREASFKRFLCDGLDRKTIRVDGQTMKLGSYHMCYRLDGKLVAVGVLDLLEHAVSSVYLFYDPDYKAWDWGKVSALREIAFAIEGKYGFYYMGFYIHSCRKMRYKGTYVPSYLMDPETLEWDELDDEFRQRLDRKKYVSLSRERQAEKEKEETDQAPSDGPGPRLADLKVAPLKGPNATADKSNDTTDALEVDSDPSDADETEIPEGSLFDYHVPGVMSLDEVSRLDLAHWKLVIRNTLVDFEDLRDWDEWKIDDPHSIKGIAAELVAATGPSLLKNSAVAFFD